MRIEILDHEHQDRLEVFEKENRRSFEKLIEPRKDSFYSKQGIRDHISQFIELYNCGKMYPSVLVVGNNIVGRANLRGIDRAKKSSVIGYRVSESCRSRGLASYMTKRLTEIAFKELGLTQVYARVLENNPASIKVLEKCQFECVGYSGETYEINGSSYKCIEYLLKNA